MKTPVRLASAVIASFAISAASAVWADGHSDESLYQSDDTIYVPPPSNDIKLTPTRPRQRPTKEEASQTLEIGTAEIENALAQIRPKLRPDFNAIPPIPAWLNGASYIVINPATNRVLIEKDADKLEEPASLTKLLAGAVMFDAISRDPDRFDLDEKILVPQWAIDTIKNHPLGIAHFRKLDAETPYKIGDLLLGMGARSDGISTLALALHFADEYYEWEGSESEKTQRFVEEMNALAQRIGMSNSEFNVTTGIRSSGTNQSTPEDMARLINYMNTEHPELMEHTFGTPRFNISDLTTWTVPTSRLFQRRPERVQNAKTGATREGYTFALTYEQAGSETPLIAVIMDIHAPNDSQARERRSQLAIDVLTVAYDTLEWKGPDAGRLIDEEIVTAVLQSKRPRMRIINPAPETIEVANPQQQSPFGPSP
ncbi:MAG: D-alanyl-D-alanine carboxypeptidase family protein [Bdellovibrionales bacterium]